MNRVRVLQMFLSNGCGGRTRAILRYWKHIDKQKFQFDFVAIGNRLSYQQEIENLGGRVYYLSCRAEENPQQFVKELEHILENKYDVVHIHTSFWRSFTVEEVAKRCGVPKVIIHSHNTSVSTIEDITLMRKMEQTHYQVRSMLTPDTATDFWACSVSAAEWLFGEEIPKEQIVIMNNAIEVEKFLFNHEIRKEYRQKFGLDSCFVIGCVGRFCYQKNQEFLINLFLAVCKKISNARLLLIGSGPLEDEMKRQAGNLGLGEKVIFASVDDDTKCGLLQAMDLYCQPSRFEGLPVSMIEAQSAGLMCLASNAITREVSITKNVDFLPLEPEMWLNRVVELSAGYERKNMCEEITAAGYNIKEQIKKVETLYTDYR